MVGEEDFSRTGNKGVVKMISTSKVDVMMQESDKWEGMLSR